MVHLCTTCKKAYAEYGDRSCPYVGKENHPESGKGLGVYICSLYEDAKRWAKNKNEGNEEVD